MSTLGLLVARWCETRLGLDDSLLECHLKENQRLLHQLALPSKKHHASEHLHVAH